jgi:TIR domain
VPQIFLSYRVDDQPFAAAFFDHELTRELGDDAVFFASRSIPFGADWEKWIFDAVSASVAVLVIIGPHWLAATNKDGRRLEDPRDFVRREVELGLQLGKQVVPVHLERRHSLDTKALPESLHALAEKQGPVVRFRDSKPDIVRLVTQLRRQIPSLRPAAPVESPAADRRPADDHSTHYTNSGPIIGNVLQGKQIGGIFFGGTSTDV